MSVPNILTIIFNHLYYLTLLITAMITNVPATPPRSMINPNKPASLSSKSYLLVIYSTRVLMALNIVFARANTKVSRIKLLLVSRIFRDSLKGMISAYELFEGGL